MKSKKQRLKTIEKCEGEYRKKENGAFFLLTCFGMRLCTSLPWNSYLKISMEAREEEGSVNKR